MPHEFLKRIIEQASDSLAESVYLRMLMDRRAIRGQLHLRGTVPTWEDIVTRAVRVSCSGECHGVMARSLMS